jgi:hypothetical protein
MERDQLMARSEESIPVTGVLPAGRDNPATALFTTRHPILRDGAVILATISTVCYFAFSEGVAAFLGSLVKMFARLAHASS